MVNAQGRRVGHSREHRLIPRENLNLLVRNGLRNVKNMQCEIADLHPGRETMCKSLDEIQGFGSCCRTVQINLDVIWTKDLHNSSLLYL